MARRLRIEFPGAIYHLMSRGDRREDIFRDEQDRQRFVQTLADVCLKAGWQVHAFVLMPNHFHLIVETPRPNLVVGMKWFLGTYTARFNRRHKLDGHLFSGRYKSLLVGGEGGYLRTVCDYVHLNPVRAKILSTNKPLRSFRWSSFPLYLRPSWERPAWLRVDRLLGECSIAQDSTSGREEFEARLEQRRAQDPGEDFRPIRQEWYFGPDQFRKELLGQMKISGSHFGPEVHESAEDKAERIIRQELQDVSWNESDVRTTRKSDLAKVRIALRLRAETTVTLEWITHRLNMGTPTYLAHLLYWYRRKKGREEDATGSRQPLPEEREFSERIREIDVKGPRPSSANKADPLPFDPAYD
jgi:REP element-mobilizing transposase RayT